MTEITSRHVSSYDEVPYESHPFSQTHPAQLASVATLFGLTAPRVESARVLELGCAAGGNLIPMAERLPNARFIGVDLSKRQVGEGDRLIRLLGLSNTELKQVSIADVDESYGTFDYVICHGVFSWVPISIREKIMDICARQLSPNGVAYVSYNTYPGWHFRGMIRDMMRYHVRKTTSPDQRTRQARSLLDFLASSVPQDGAYSTLLRTELEGLRHLTDSYLTHEHLEDVNDPLYFHQFVEMAGRHNLRYLGESHIGSMITGNLGSDIHKAMKLLASDQIESEQYMDFLRNRTFRQTLLVRAEQVPDWNIHPERVTGLHVASAGRAVGDKPTDLRSKDPGHYQPRNGPPLVTNRPILKAAMAVLADAWPGTVPFSELRFRSRERLGGSPDEPRQAGADTKELATGLLSAYLGSDLIEFHAIPITPARADSLRPKASGVARALAAAGRPVTNIRHEIIRLPELERNLLPLLDGTRDRTSLVDELTKSSVAGQLRLMRDNKPVTDPAETCAALTMLLDGAFRNIAQHALLVS